MLKAIKSFSHFPSRILFIQVLQLIREILLYLQASVQSFMNSKVYLQKACEYYSNHWSIERKEVLHKLREVSYYIEEQAKIRSMRNIAHSSVGLGGFLAGIITAPFTFAVSLGLTVAGVATSASSGISGVNHMTLKLAIIQTQLNNAKEILQKHEESCRKMKKLLEAIDKHRAAFVAFKCMYVKNMDIKLSVEGLSALTALCIIIDMHSLIYNAGSGGVLKIPRLCEQRDQLKSVIFNMQNEYDDLSDFFSAY